MKTPVKKEVDYFDVETTNYQHNTHSNYKPVTIKKGTTYANPTHTTTYRTSSHYKTQPLHLGDSTLQRSHDSNWYKNKQPSQSYKKTQVVTTNVYKNPTTSYTRGQQYTQGTTRYSTSNSNRNLYTSQAYNQPSTFSNRKLVTTKKVTTDSLHHSGLTDSKLQGNQHQLSSSYLQKYH